MMDMIVTIGAWALIWSSSTLLFSLIGAIFDATRIVLLKKSADEGSARGAHYGTIVGFMLPGIYLWVLGMLWAIDTIGVNWS